MPKFTEDLLNQGRRTVKLILAVLITDRKRYVKKRCDSPAKATEAHKEGKATPGGLDNRPF